MISQEKEGFLFERTAPSERGQSPLLRDFTESFSLTLAEKSYDNRAAMLEGEKMIAVPYTVLAALAASFKVNP